MTAAPAALPPPYGRATLAEVLPSVAAHLLDGAEGAPRDILNLPAARRYVVCLIDGLGADVLARSAEVAPGLAAALPGSRRLSSTCPSTTATAITSLSTGDVPGQHGIVGYTFRSAPGRLLNALSWADGPRNIAAFQPVSPWWERLSGAGVSVTAIGSVDFMGSGLTRAALRGARYIPVADEADFAGRVGLVVAAAGAGEASLVYVYERSLDHAGHAHGWQSARWRTALSRIDAFVADLAARLGPDVCLLVTGDHGMVDVRPQRKVWVEDDPRLMRDVELVGGEARFRHLYTTAPERVAVAWSAVLGGRALVVPGVQAIAAGWFGPVSSAVRARIGDVLVLPREDWALTSRAARAEGRMVGMHGGPDPAEMGVPLLVDPGRGTHGR